MHCCKSKVGSGLPSLPTQLKDLAITMAASIAHLTKTGELAATPETVKARISVCQACDQFTGERCRKCGCFVHAKAALAASFCPLTKW